MIRVNNTRMGFFSSLFYIIENYHIAETKDDDIEINSFSLCYTEYDQKTSFFQYFDNMEINKKLKYDNFNSSNIFSIENINKTPILSLIKDQEKRKYVSFLIKKYLKIKGHIQEKINFHLKQFDGKKVLGLHIRQTDHGFHGKLLNFNVYVEEIKKHIENYDILYVMSDNHEDIKNMCDIFSDRIYYLDDILRSDKRKDQAPHIDKKFINKYKLGEDVLIETMLLSNCDLAIMTNSNICNFVMCYNPYIKYNILDLNLKNIE